MTEHIRKAFNNIRSAGYSLFFLFFIITLGYGVEYIDPDTLSIYKKFEVENTDITLALVGDTSGGMYDNVRNLVVYKLHNNKYKLINSVVLKDSGGCPYYFGAAYLEDEKFILISTKFFFYIYDIDNHNSIGPLKPRFFGIGCDAISGMLCDLKIILDGQCLIGYLADDGPFSYNLTDLSNAYQIFPVSLPNPFDVVRLFLFTDNEDDCIYNGIIVYGEWKADYNIAFTGMKLDVPNNDSLGKQHYVFFDESEELLRSDIDARFVILLKIGKDNKSEYIVINLVGKEILELPFVNEQTSREEIEEYLEEHGFGIQLTKDEYYLSDRKLSDDELNELKYRFTRLNITTHEFYEKPDVVLRHGEEIYSIYMEERLIYAGHYLDAWTERMAGKKSACYRFSDKAKAVFKEILEYKK